MTAEELKLSCDKFRQYLEANDVHVLAHAILATSDGHEIGLVAGNTEMRTEMALQIVAEQVGLKVVPL